MTTGETILVAGLVGVGALVAYRALRPATMPAPRVATAGAGVSFGQLVQRQIAGATGVPVEAVGNAAQNAPGWLKLAVFPVGVTAATANLVENPVGTVKNVGSKAVNLVRSLF